jgi:hypothetical protein
MNTKQTRAKGAGRKPLPPDTKLQQVTIHLKPQIAAWLKQQTGRGAASRLIERLLEEERNRG